MMTNMTQVQASSTCLPVVLFTATTGAISYQMNGAAGCVDWNGAMLIGGFGMLTAPLGIRLARWLPGWMVSRALGWFMLAAIPLLVWQDVLDWINDQLRGKDTLMEQELNDQQQQQQQQQRQIEEHGQQHRQIDEHHHRVQHARESLTSTHERMGISVILGALTGIVGGAFGVGGGVLLVPALSQLTDSKTAAATSLASIIPSGIVGSLVTMSMCWFLKILLAHISCL
jgi:uncharacterized membrane protein YfcA